MMASVARGRENPVANDAGRVAVACPWSTKALQVQGWNVWRRGRLWKEQQCERKFSMTWFILELILFITLLNNSFCTHTRKLPADLERNCLLSTCVCEKYSKKQYFFATYNRKSTPVISVRLLTSSWPSRLFSCLFLISVDMSSEIKVKDARKLETSFGCMWG